MLEGLARVLAHPLRGRILLEYAGGLTCPSDVARTLARPLNVVSYHTRVLARTGFVELVRTERRRGATTHHYRATIEGVLEDEQWTAIEPRLRRRLVREGLALALADAEEAARAGGFDVAHAHLSRVPLQLDAAGVDAATRLLRRTVEALAALQAASADGPRQAFEVVLLGFDVARPH